MKIHIVQKGDTLWKIAKKYGVNFEELKHMNSQLSNPDMIMPGMKIKVPTTGGNIKKEVPYSGQSPKLNMGAKKEHPFAKEKPIQAPLPVKEAPVKEVPIAKEVPKEVPKIVPTPPFIPKMPQPIIPEIDINNYYLMNMANVSVEQKQQQAAPPPPPPPPPPVIKPETKPIKFESPESIECPVQLPLEGGYCEPMYPDCCYPITPVMPGPGFCYPEGLPSPAFAPYPVDGGVQPYPVAEPYPQVQGAMYNPTPYMSPGMLPGVAGAHHHYHHHDESSSFMPHTHMESSFMYQNPGAYAAPTMPYQQPGGPMMMPQYGQMGVPYGQMPAGMQTMGRMQPSQMMGYPQMAPFDGTMDTDMSMMPQQMGGMPQQMPMMPQQMSMMPQQMQGMPQQMPMMPQEMQGMPQQMPMIPQQMQAMPPVHSGGDCGCGGTHMGHGGAYGPGMPPVYAPTYGQQMFQPPYMSPYGYAPMPRNPYEAGDHDD